MNKLRLLLKLQRVNMLRLNEIRFTQDKKQKRRLILMLFVYVILSLMGIFYASMMAWALDQAGLSFLLPAFALMLSTGACLMMSVIRSPAMFFNPAGWDTLFALPFCRSTLVGAKLISLYLSASLLSFIITLPHTVFYTLSFGMTPYGLLVWLSVALFSPLLPMSLGMVIAAIPALLLQRLKNRSLLSALLILPFITWLMLKAYTLPMNSLENTDLMKTIILGLETSLQRIYPPLGWILKGMQGNFPNLLSFIALNILSMLFTGILLLTFLPRLQQAMGRISLRRANKKQSPVLKPLWALTLKEARRMASSPLWLMNTGMVLWLAPMALFLLPFIKPGIISALLALPLAQGLLSRYLPLMACAVCSLTVPSSVSISMEGKNVWLACTAPVSSAIILSSKALFSLLFCLPPLLLTSLLLTIHLRLNVWLSLLCFLLPLSLCAFQSAAGLMLDLRFARFDWENEQQIIKSSAQTGLTLLTGVIMLALMFAVLYLAPAGNTLWLGFVLAVFLLVLSAVLMKRLFKTTIYQIK